MFGLIIEVFIVRPVQSSVRKKPMTVFTNILHF